MASVKNTSVLGGRSIRQVSLLKQKELEATTIKKHYKSMLAICLTLAKKVEEWKPPLDA